MEMEVECMYGEPLEEVDCFKYLGRKWQLIEDVAHKINEGYRGWGALKSVLSNRGLGIKARSANMKE